MMRTIATIIGGYEGEGRIEDQQQGIAIDEEGLRGIAYLKTRTR
jgi:hypothetical protein